MSIEKRVVVNVKTYERKIEEFDTSAIVEGTFDELQVSEEEQRLLDLETAMAQILGGAV